MGLLNLTRTYAALIEASISRGDRHRM
ncbi:hypothetical protein I310_05850 [Cryptococcus deuterogattii CA1014]|uniref:Unplaced genomic scaffold supercont1.19, whole genome shotgun sequence n=1 Tax=Cryptococcus deuterogattii Ram5 TaxID=1296110 RepID=A0A0D0UXZ5_9TREE|nr:hypothetical protein I352_05730 [Cryptococcus deuterogattii MMRL2647]KIR37610.1 hypothetical protein I313_06333 [Cryptococcus deuterogattii Ram5]KIR70224.1 hypothetical protein I310_05850 [Cryptococcus deuterogattii CA1014]